MDQERFNLLEKLALGHALTALVMSRQWSLDSGFPQRREEDEASIKTINQMLYGTPFYQEDVTALYHARNSWPQVPQ